MNRRTEQRLRGLHAQRGAALTVVMLLLVIVTLLGLAVMRNSILQERMAMATFGRSMAFQAAEVGLRRGEEWARASRPTIPPTAATCDAGICSKGADPWRNPSFWTSADPDYKELVDYTNGIKAKYVLEDYGQRDGGGSDIESCAKVNIGGGGSCANGRTLLQMYRITSYAKAPNGAEVTLQTLYAAP